MRIDLQRAAKIPAGFFEVAILEEETPALQVQIGASRLYGFKYRLAFVVNGVCVLRYDNEAGKGDHKHIGEEQRPYTFTTPAQLLEDFWHDVDHWRS